MGDSDDRPDPHDEIARADKSNRRRGTRRVYRRDSRARLLVDLLSTYRWPISLVLFVAAVGLAVGFFRFDLSIPDEFWGLLWYGALGGFVGAVPAYLLVRWLHSPDGVEVWDHDPITDSHRHLRVGPDLWDDIVVRSPWGSVEHTGKLKQVTINGVSGYEMMDFRVSEDGTPVAVTTWLGEADSSMLRTYRSALRYSRKRLSRKAEQAIMQDANREAIIRETAERVIYRMIRNSERSGMPGGDEIQPAVSEVMEDMGLGDPLAADDLGDGRGDRDVTRPQPEVEETEEVRDAADVAELFESAQNGERAATDGGET